MHENIEFLKAFVKDPLNVGAIAPSSLVLAKKMVEGIEPNRNSTILELGIGTGSFTRLLREISPNKKSYLGIEFDKNLVASLKKKFPDMHILEGNACEASMLHKQSNLGKVDYIISGLPFVSMPSEISKKILAEIDIFMEHGCMFRTFQYAHGYYLPPAIKFRKLMHDRYGVLEKSSLIVKNVPPAFILTWRTS